MTRSRVSATGSQPTLSVVGSAVDREEKDSTLSVSAPAKRSHVSANAPPSSVVGSMAAASRLSPLPESRVKAAEPSRLAAEATSQQQLYPQQHQRQLQQSPAVKLSQSMPTFGSSGWMSATATSDAWSLPEPQGGAAPSLHWCRDTARDRAEHLSRIPAGSITSPHLLRAARLASVHCARALPRTRVHWRREYGASGPVALGTAKYKHCKRLGDPLHWWPRLPEERWSDDEDEVSIPPPATFGHIRAAPGLFSSRAGSSQGLRQIGHTSILA
mmetsp:Transcript_31366/g.73164  ORF Transcript_31366/g.73164 Transcript_31366/m.73164 type:complete len:272 (-) Transcript_31366:100-915(-)|eukprot:CAMPEP_0178415274 /NCGR_PEP_ID=MMETSP0689_2-20121128/23468_1 /TAXON_ID=160604 /ORGANISM="Amphidinium massartii, Strain CS-259" /LENGTH=271 /DNA_ID=CAMNT_0020036591 /DNA_START=52 /DNA_END=867 /DNA_ORIENTATION=-